MWVVHGVSPARIESMVAYISSAFFHGVSPPKPPFARATPQRSSPLPIALLEV